MPEDLGDKTEAPTPHRLEEARARGQVAKSQDFAGAIELCGAFVAVLLLGGLIAKSMSSAVRRALEPASDAIHADGAVGIVKGLAADAALALGPVLGVVFIVSLAAHMVQTGFVASSSALEPKFERLNPIAGFARLFDRRSAMRSAAGIAKVAVVGVIAWVFLSGVLVQIVGLPRLSMLAGYMVLGGLAVRLVLWLLVLLLALGAADWAFQRWQHQQDLRMTKEDVKNERRSMEGDPQIKSRRARLARQIAMQRIGSVVPTADVIVTNPTHFSVALRYDEATMRAPKVVAKGVDVLAVRIRQVAILNGVPIVERPPLARALYAGVEVGREVSPEFYQAVAEVLAYVYRLDREAAA